MRRSRFSALCFLLLIVLPAAACTMTSPSQIKTGEIVVEDVMATRELPAHIVDEAAVNIAADDFRRNGRSGAALVMPILRHCRHSERLHAIAVGEGYKRTFAKYGVPDLKLSFAETSNKVAARHAVLAYTSTVAQPPRNCTRIPGATGPTDLRAMEDYSIGCETRTMLAKMIARPEDLMGVAGTPDELSRRAGPVSEGYMSGRTNAPLTGLNASTTGTTSVSGGGISAGSPTSQ